MANNIIQIETQHAPPALGPYSQGVMVSSPVKLLFVSGQLPVNPATGKIVEGDIRTKTKQIIDNIEAILKAAGSGLEHVVRVDVFLTNFSVDFPAMNLEYLVRFNTSVPPARQTVGVAELPLGVPIEISCIATIPDA